MKGFRLVILGSEPWHITKWMRCPVHGFSAICTVPDIAFQGGELTPRSIYAMTATHTSVQTLSFTC